MTDRELFDTYNQDIYRICLYVLHNRADAEDLCQDVFIKALQANRSEILNLRAWLLRIAVNTCREHLKRKKRGLFKESLLFWMNHSESASNLTEPKVVHKESETELMELLVELPEKTRIVLTLKYVNDLKNPEIAEILDIPEGTVKSRVHSGLNQMKKKLTAKHPFPLRGGHLIERKD